MRRDLFESFYTDGISRLAKEIVEKHPELAYNENLNGVYEEYLNQKTLLKVLLKKTPESKNSSLLDGHKISACIACAIIKVRLITCSKIEDDSDKVPYLLEKSLRMNEQLALFSGINCLIGFMANDPKNLYYDGKLDHIELTEPETFYPERSDYWSSLIRALYYTNICSGVNPLLLANIYFLLDRFHRLSVELEGLKKELSKGSQTPD